MDELFANRDGSDGVGQTLGDGLLFAIRTFDAVSVICIASSLGCMTAPQNSSAFAKSLGDSKRLRHLIKVSHDACFWSASAAAEPVMAPIPINAVLALVCVEPPPTLVPPMLSATPTPPLLSHLARLGGGERRRRALRYQDTHAPNGQRL